MSKKITVLMVMFISILSIAIVAFFGIAADNRPKTIPVEEIMFVDVKGGDQNYKSKRNMTTITERTETLEIYYYIYPNNASNKNTFIYLEGDEKCDTLLLAHSTDGVISIDFQGVDWSDSNFLVRLDTEDGHKTAQRRFQFTFEEE